jgi:CubicO group peptidase (beta-lactamase class C family)
VVVAARKGVVFFHEGFNGFSPETQFHPASLGKMVSGLLFARAVDQGLLAFDQHVGDVLPDWAEGDRSEVTFRNLLNHVAGLTGHGSYGGLRNAYLDNALALQSAKFSQPRKRFVYSGDGSNVAGKALELTTGTSSFRLLYDNLQQPFDPNVQQTDMGVAEAFSAMYLARLGQMVLQDGAYNGKRYYSAGFLKTLWPKPISQSVPGFEGAEEWGIGFEWMVDPDGPRSQGVLGPNVIGHHSATGVVMRIDPHHDLVLVVGRNAYAGAWGDNERRIDRFVVGVADSLRLSRIQ